MKATSVYSPGLVQIKLFAQDILSDLLTNGLKRTGFTGQQQGNHKPIIGMNGTTQLDIDS